MVVISIVCAHSFGQSFRSINCAIFRTGSLETVNDVNACVECQGHPWRTSRPRSSSSSMRKVCQLWFFGDPSLRLKFVHLLTKPAGFFVYFCIYSTCINVPQSRPQPTTIFRTALNTNHVFHVFLSLKCHHVIVAAKVDIAMLCSVGIGDRRCRSFFLHTKQADFV